jgi:ribosomal protein S18 acetylase RimI-like enzyme
MRTARLDATANNAPTIALYQSEGFEIVGKGDLDVNPDGDSLIPFVVMERLL